jgi:hypothetical protein
MPSLRTLTRRELNRATLARQLLLTRHTLTPAEAVQQVGGLQAQVTAPPFIGLWTRLTALQRETVHAALHARTLVRVPYWRSTLHWVTAATYQQQYSTVQPALIKGLNSFHGRNIKGLDVAQVVATVRPFIAAQPRTMGAVRAFLLTHYPTTNGNALDYIARTYLPLVQVPTTSTWGYPSAATYTLAEQWLGQAVDPAPNIRALLGQYLAAFGPASIADLQTWSGMTKLREATAPFLGDLVRYRDEDGNELYDLPDQVLPSADTPAPARFVPEYDNLMISYQDRSRVLPAAYRPQIFLSAARVLATVLLDGYVAGTWKASETKNTAMLTITPFRPFSAAEQAALLPEGEALLRFIVPQASSYTLDFAALGSP